MKIKFKHSTKLVRQGVVAGDKNFCAVIAYCNIAGVPFKEGAEVIKKNCYRDTREGTNYIHMSNYLHATARLTHSNISLRDFVANNKAGKYYCRINRHIFAVIDGVVCDNYMSPLTIIKEAYKIELA